MSADVIAAWARHHFASSDDAVQQYICGALLLAAEEGGGLRDQADMLRDFVPGGHSHGWLPDSLGELEAVLQQPEPSAPWLGTPPAPPAPSALGGDSGERGGAPQPPDSYLPPSASALRVSAAEFRPGGAPSALAAAGQPGTQALPLHLAGADGEAAASHEAGEGGDGGGPGWDAAWDAAGGSGHSAGPHADDAWRAGDNAGWASADAGGGEGLPGGPAAQEAFLAVLSDQFPLFSHAALRQLFEEQQRSLSDTIATLCGLEAELQGQAAAAAGPAGGAPGPQHAAGGGPAAPQFGEDDFPSLGPSPAGAARGLGPGGAAGGYASVARVGARSGVQPASRPRPRHAVAAPAAAAPAPIWRQAEGVRQVSTGAAVAAEYAALRSEARDHARLRNACFQQATQAYLAGNFRLARELGAKGRWHGEQMHAAHATAATEIFARRNRDALAGGGGGGPPTLDLHGLHVAEALQQLERVLAGRRGGGRLRVVVGRGTHGKVPARLPAAVRRWLHDQGLRFSEPYAGLLEIDP